MLKHTILAFSFFVLACESPDDEVMLAALDDESELQPNASSAAEGVGTDLADAQTPTMSEAVNNTNPNFLQVYVNNVENLQLPGAECPGDWKDLIHYMRSYSTAPDLFIVQQVSDRDELDVLIGQMEARLPGNYGGVIADPSPAKGTFPCDGEKARQTNAIIWRKGRLELLDSARWQSLDEIKDSGKCDENTQPRTLNIRAKFRDKLNDKLITVASVHWPTPKSGGGVVCATENANRLAQAMDSWDTSLRIWGGDTNVTDLNESNGWRAWYERMNGDRGGKHGYRDAIYDLCSAGNDPIKPCLHDNATIGKDKRIDYLFARKQNGMPKVTAAHTVTFNEADAASDDPHPNLNYSDHRAVRARIYY